jgi:hypothetical protein
MSIVLPNVNAAVFSGMEESLGQMLYCRDASVETAIAFQSSTGLKPARQNKVSQLGLGAEIVEKFCIH